MNTYYRLYEDGRICDFCEFGENEKVPSFVLAQYKKTNRKIIKSADGNYVFEDEIDLEEEIKRKAEKEFQEIKNSKIADLKAERDALEVEDITVKGNTFDYDDKARERINNAIIALQVTGAEINWTLADNRSVPVVAFDLIEVVARVAERSNALHIAYRNAKQAVLDAETIEAVQAVRLEVVGDTEASHA